MVRGGFFFCSRRFSIFSRSHILLSVNGLGTRCSLFSRFFLFFFFSDHTSI